MRKFNEWLAAEHPDFVVDESWRNLAATGAMLAGGMFGGAAPGQAAERPPMAQQMTQDVQEVAPGQYVVNAKAVQSRLFKNSGVTESRLKNDAIAKLAKHLGVQNLQVSGVTIDNMANTGGYVTAKVTINYGGGNIGSNKIPNMRGYIDDTAGKVQDKNIENKKVTSPNAKKYLR